MALQKSTQKLEMVLRGERSGYGCFIGGCDALKCVHMFQNLANFML